MGTGCDSNRRQSAQQGVEPQAHFDAGLPGRPPPRQQPYKHALKLGFDRLLSDVPGEEKLRSLGAGKDSGTIRVPVLNRRLVVDLARREVRLEGGKAVKQAWAVLVVHYLCAQNLAMDAREVPFAHFPDCRGYLSVFEKRVIGRFLATSGRSAAVFEERSSDLGAEFLPGPGMRRRFRVLPRVPITIARYEGDEEFGPGASIVYQADAQDLLPAEDRIVAVELLLDQLAGKSIEEEEGEAA